ncbi:MAG: hypothetical protein K8T91_18055 [Planctomycetes bacterium]|nr:hypothetical protein [Planctomycetota bacterium]
MIRWLRFTVPPLVVLAACGIYRATLASSAKSDALRQLSAHDSSAANMPNLIAPRYDDPRIATDAQLHDLLERMKPTVDPLDTNVLVHALRLWGPHAEFGDARHPSGSTMLGYFLNDAEFRKLAGEKVPPLFAAGADGVTVRPWTEDSPHKLTGAVHVDDLLATLAESGIPHSHPLVMRDSTGHVADLLQGAMRRFHRRQQEYEWSAISYARYLFPAQRWENRYGQPIDVAALVDELMEQPMPNGVCGGAHRLEALVVLLRADDQHHVLAKRTRKKIVDYLARTSALLTASQHSEGYWDRNWYLGTAGATPVAGAKQDTTYDRILTTGHQLEWLALAPPEVQPPRETIVRAGQWLVRAMLAEDDKNLKKHYGPFSHAARALCLWRSKDPFDAWLQK